jgi:hypothetical protein
MNRPTMPPWGWPVIVTQLVLFAAQSYWPAAWLTGIWLGTVAVCLYLVRRMAIEVDKYRNT